MTYSKQLKCNKCGKPVGYVTVSAKSFLVSVAAADNVKLVATCLECSGKTGLYCRNF
jgi:hypothetical protein